MMMNMRKQSEKRNIKSREIDETKRTLKKQQTQQTNLQQQQQQQQP